MQDQSPARKDENLSVSDYENDISMYLVDSLSCNINSDGVTDGVEVENYDVEAYPPGWRFAPTDVEAIYCYLKNKVEKRPLPAVNIKEVDIYKFNPQDLAERYHPNCDKPKEWYFFTPRDRKYRNGKRPNRKAGDGFWRATGADKEVKMKDKVIGWKRALVFYYGKPPKGQKTSWIMHEYMLKDAHPSLTIDTSSPDMKLDGCVLCKIYKNTRKSDIEQEQYTSQKQPLYTFQNQPSSSYQYMQLGTQAPSIENNFQSQPSSSHQYQQLGGQQEPHTTISYATMTTHDPTLSRQSYQGMQLGAQASSTENNFQSQPSSSHQCQQLGGQQEPHTIISYSPMMTTYDPMLDNTTNYNQMGYLNPTALHSFPSAFDAQEYNVNTAMENYVNNVPFPEFSGVPGNFGDDMPNNRDVNM